MFSCCQVGEESRGTLGMTPAASEVTAVVEEYEAEGKVVGAGEAADVVCF